MPSNYRANDSYVNEQVDLDDIFVSDAWLVDQFVGGTLFACGYNGTGQLGNGTTTFQSSPIQVGSLTNWKQVSAGAYFNMVIKTDGTLWSCGYNYYGSLGVSGLAGQFVGYSSPIQVGSLTNWKQVSAGYYHTAAIKTDGTLWSWGYNAQGQLGNSTTTDYSSPIQIGSLTNWKQVSAAVQSLNTAAIKTDGTLWAWGQNSYGNLGNGTIISYSSPIQIGSLTNWKTISCDNLNVAIKTDGTLWSWGRNDFGQLGNGTTTNYSSPIQIGSLTNWKQVSVGSTYTATIKTDGTLWAWGRNAKGQLGNGTTIPYSSPIQVGSLTNWKQVSTQSSVLAAIKTDGTLWACGYNQFGTVGNGTNTPYSSPIQVGSLTNWKQVSHGINGLLALTFKDLG